MVFLHVTMDSCIFFQGVVVETKKRQPVPSAVPKWPEPAAAALPPSPPPSPGLG